MASSNRRSAPTAGGTAPSRVLKRATDAAVFLFLVALCFVVRTGQAHAQEVLLVVPDAANLSAQDSTKKALIES